MNQVDIPSTYRKTQEHAAKFWELCRHTAVQRLTYLSRVDWDLIEHDAWDQLVFASHMAVITVAGKDLKIFFKAHFRPSGMAKSVSNCTDTRRCVDFLNEFANLFAGGIKQILLEQKLICGISLPTVLSGFDEIIFSDKIRPHRYLDCFKLKNQDTEIFITVSTDIMSTFVFDNIQNCAVEAEDEGEIEFL